MDLLRIWPVILRNPFISEYIFNHMDRDQFSYTHITVTGIVSFVLIMTNGRNDQDNNPILIHFINDPIFSVDSP